MHSDVLEILGMIKRPQRDGVLYLFPEYGHLEETLMDTALIKPNTNTSSRNTYFINPETESHYIAKIERDDTTEVRQCFGYPQFNQYNMTLIEICIERILSKLISFEDDITTIEFEKPIGYYANDKIRTGFFKYENRPQITFEQLKPQFQDMTQKILKQKNVLNKIINTITYTNEYMQAIETYRPYNFLDMITSLNSIEYNDKEELIFQDDKKHTTFFFDFEFSNINIPTYEIEKIIDQDLIAMTKNLENIQKLNQAGNDIDELVYVRKYILSELEQASPILSDRVKTVLKDTGYFEGHIHTYGPGFDIVKQIPTLSPDSLIID
ncbi:MAG: hypothetical protein K0B02_03200 [DPANN group archaeon]|nr:hypothetical protein [DPANN group archaeon]